MHGPGYNCSILTQFNDINPKNQTITNFKAIFSKLNSKYQKLCIRKYLRSSMEVYGIIAKFESN